MVITMSNNMVMMITINESIEMNVYAYADSIDFVRGGSTFVTFFQL